eukprot:COSAG01_NODE_5622_length_4141_cov_15.405740_4_plen_60_part_00
MPAPYMRPPAAAARCLRIASQFMNEWRLDDSLNEMHDLFLTTCVKELYDTLTWCIKTRF